MSKMSRLKKNLGLAQAIHLMNRVENAQYDAQPIFAARSGSVGDCSSNNHRTHLSLDQSR